VTHFPLIHQGLDVAPILADLDAAPDLWDLYHERRTSPGSPHGEMQDIWVRTRARGDLEDPDAFRKPFWPVFYDAWHRLPSIQPVVWALMGMTKGTHLGQILLTRIPPGHRVHTHVDRGWSVDYWDRKFYVVLQGNAQCVNQCVDECVVMPTGSIFEFENRLPHSVQNDGETTRISLIVTLRADG
jgi:mannose-6-phosphate isomerase-like protein (cupin superfamily)